MKNKHTTALEKMIRNPDIVCARNPLFIAKEVNFYDAYSDDNFSHPGRLIAQPDLIAYDGSLYIVEYKASTKHKSRAIEQLQTSFDFVRKHLKYQGTIYSLFMHGNPIKKKVINCK